MSECTDVLNQCHIHVALRGSQFDNEGTVRHMCVRFCNNITFNITLGLQIYHLFCNKALDLLHLIVIHFAFGE